MTPAPKRPVVFTPLKGALSVARVLAHRCGLGQLWEGQDGIEGVLADKLKELGVPHAPVPLTGPEGMTVRQFAEQGGFIKKRKPNRRVK